MTTSRCKFYEKHLTKNFHVVTNRTCVSSVLYLNASNSLDAYTYAMCCGFKYMVNKRRYAINYFQALETSQTNWRNLQPIVEKVDKVSFILSVKSSLFTRLSTRITIEIRNGTFHMYCISSLSRLLSNNIQLHCWMTHQQFQCSSSLHVQHHFLNKRLIVYQIDNLTLRGFSSTHFVFFDATDPFDHVSSSHHYQQ